MGLSYNEAPTGDRLKAYQVCQERGHEASNISLTMDPPHMVCKHCGVAYRFETTVIELAPPKPIKRQHMCGMMGFNPMKGDLCPVCDNMGPPIELA